MPTEPRVDIRQDVMLLQPHFQIRVWCREKQTGWWQKSQKGVVSSLRPQSHVGFVPGELGLTGFSWEWLILPENLAANAKSFYSQFPPLCRFCGMRPIGIAGLGSSLITNQVTWRNIRNSLRPLAFIQSLSIICCVINVSFPVSSSHWKKTQKLH